MSRFRSIADVAGVAVASGRTPDAHPQKVPDVPGGPRPAGNVSRPQEPRANKYGGKCSKCGAFVPEGAGVLGPKVGGKFTVEHREGECSTAKPVTDEQIATKRRDWYHVGTPVPDGKFTVVLTDGSHVTFDIDTSDEWRDSKLAQNPDAKVTVVRVLTGTNNDEDYTAVGEFFEYRHGRGVKLWKKYAETQRYVDALYVLIGDPRAAAAAYGMSSGHCGLCGRTLTVPESIAAGIGPVCMEKAGW